MLLAPPGKFETLRVAMKLEPDAVTGAVPIGDPPSEKVTVPLGPGPVLLAGVTVAVKVTDSPYVEGLSDDFRVVVVPMTFTTSLTVLDVLPAKSYSPR
jgi:hypothetical protein